MLSIKESFFWSTVEQVGPQIVGFGISVVLARLLEPGDYGLMGMLALFMGVAQVFADSGLSASLVQRKSLTADDETSVCAMNIAAGVVLAGLLCLIAPLVARFYSQPILMPLLCVQSLSIVVSSFCILQSALLVRTMQFHKTAAVGTAGIIVSGVTGIAMAYHGWGVWSLVGSGLSGNLVRLVLYWTISSWRPHGKIRWECIRSMWGFSSNLLYCSLIGIAYRNIYSVVIGKVYSPESLGFYDRANSLRMLPVGTMTDIVNRVAFPLFSRCQDDKSLLLRRIREIVRGTLLLSAGALTLLAVVADPLIPLLMTDKWSPTIPLLRILCYAGVFYPISALYLMALQAQGYSNLNFRLESIKMVLGLLTVAWVYRYGVTALAWSVVGLTFVAYFLNAWYNVKLLGYRWWFQAFDILPTLILCATIGWIAWWAGSLVSGGALAILFVQSGTFIILLGFVVFLFRKLFFRDVWKQFLGAAVWLRQSNAGM